MRPAYVDYTNCYQMDFVQQELAATNTTFPRTWQCRRTAIYAMVTFKTSADGSGAAFMKCCMVKVENPL
jgi:hypothetical protein